MQHSISEDLGRAADRQGGHCQVCIVVGALGGILLALFFPPRQARPCHHWRARHHTETRKTQSCFANALGVTLDPSLYLLSILFLVIATTFVVQLLMFFRPDGGCGSTPEPKPDCQISQVQHDIDV